MLSQTFLGTLAQLPPSWVDNDPATLSRRLKLVSFEEQGSKPYTFTYNSTPLPYKTSCAVDHWGYYNGVNNSTLIPNLTKVTNGISASAPFPDMLKDVYHIAADRGADSNFMKACVLEKIKYPTGGVTALNYEANTFSNYAIPPAGYNEAIEQYDVYRSRKGSDTQVTYPEIFTPVQIPGSTTFTLNVKIEGLKGGVQPSDLTNPSTGETITPQMRKDALFNTLKNATVNLVQYSLTGNYEGVIKTWKLPDAAFYVSYDNITTASLVVTDQIQLSRNHKYGLSVSVSYAYGTFDYVGGDVQVGARLSNFVPKPFTGESIGGGLRIKDIKSYESEASTLPVTTTQYLYAGGKLMLPLRYLTQKRYYLCGIPNEEPYATQISNSNNMSTNTGGLGQMVGYDGVTEKKVDNGNPTQNNGYIKYQYTNHALFVGGSLPAVTQWTNGLETDQDVYDSQDNLKRTIQRQYKDLYAVNSTHDKFYAGYTGYQMPEHQTCFDQGAAPSFYPPVYDLSYYYIFEFNNQIDYEIETSYDASLGAVISKTFQYNSNSQVISEITYSGDLRATSITPLQLSEVKTYFPANPPSSTTSNVADMLTRNFLLPLKTEHYKNSTKVYEQVLDYTLFSNTDRENSAWTRSQYAPVKITERKSGSTGNDLITNLVYSNGNVVEVSDNKGVPVTIIWDYKQCLPVAKIENAKFSAISANITSCSAQCDTGQINCSAKWTCMRSQLPNTKITNYEYNALDGVISITDVNGKASTYTYDALSRLIDVRDNSGNITEFIDYRLRD